MTPRQAATRLRAAETRTVLLDGAEIVYREVGASDGIPLVALNHLAANLDNWDPRIIDPLAADRRVILIGYRGVGRSGGRVRTSIEEMAADAIAATRELGLDRFDLFGQSMGGMVAFTRTAGGTQAGREYLASLRERVTDRDTAVSPRVLRAQSPRCTAGVSDRERGNHRSPAPSPSCTATATG
jgi:hypothetical protein